MIRTKPLSLISRMDAQRAGWYYLIKTTEYQKWKRLLHHFYEPFPIVEHYK